MMKEELKVIVEQFNLFEKEASQCVLLGNKTAGRRARRITLNIEKLLKQFRKNSVQAGQSSREERSSKKSSSSSMTRSVPFQRSSSKFRISVDNENY